MTDRDRLIELIDNFGDDISFCDICERPREDCDGCINEQLADYLLANGVFILPEDLRDTEDFSISAFIEAMQMYKEKDRYIKPPCKFGDTIFAIPSKVNCELNILHNMKQNNRVYEQVIDHITIWQNDYMLYTCDGLCAVRGKAYKDTWFLTRWEAEQALKEREG